MKNLIQNEWKKIICKKKFRILCFILLVIGFLSSYKAKDDLEVAYMTSMPATIEKQYEAVKERSMPMIRKANNTQKSIYVAQAAILEEEISITEKQKENLSKLNQPNANWKAILRQDIMYLNRRKELLKKEKATHLIEEVDKEVKLKQYYLDKNIPYEKEAKPTAFYAFPGILYCMGTFFMLLIIGVLAADIISDERQRDTIKMLLTKPVSRGKIIFSKYITIVLTCNVVVIAVQGITFVIHGIFNGFGNPAVPLIIGTKYRLDPSMILTRNIGITEVIGSSQVLPLWEVSLQLLLLQFLLITACVSFAFLLSTISKHNVVSSGIVALVIIFSFVLTVNQTFLHNIEYAKGPSVLGKIFPLLFGAYFNLYVLVSGFLAKRAVNPQITVQLMVIVCMTWIVGCYTLSHFLFTKRDML